MLNKKTVLLASLFCLLSVALHSQNSTSPYSALGPGDVISSGYIPNAAMGGVGISNPNIWSLNSVNPATLSWNTFNVFEFGISGESRKLSTTQQSTGIGSGSLEYVALGIPIAYSDSIGNRWTMAISLKPFSVVNYDVSSEGEVVGEADAVVLTQSGEGGINSLSIDNGVKLGKNFSVGLKSTYLFGPTLRESTNTIYFEEIREATNLVGEIVNDTILVGDYSVAYSNRGNVSGFLFEFGALHTYRLSKKGYLNTGIIYSPEQNISSKDFAKLERRDLLGNTITSADTLTLGNGEITLPSKFGIGLSYTRTGVWTIAGDMIIQQWENYRNFNGNNDGLQNVVQFKFGAQITPDITSISSYLKRSTYKIGVDFGKTPYLVDNVRVSEFGINFGISLPVSNASRINVALKYGQRGTQVNGLIREEFFKVSIGASFNGGRWKKLPRFN